MIPMDIPQIDQPGPDMQRRTLRFEDTVRFRDAGKGGRR